MQAYGRKKSSTKVAGHQNCGDCHPVQKNKKKRARQDEQTQIKNTIIEEDKK